MVFFHHLYNNNIKYKDHFQLALGYSWQSFKASFYFFIHAIYPDVYEYHGSHTIELLEYDLIRKT